MSIAKRFIAVVSCVALSIGVLSGCSGCSKKNEITTSDKKEKETKETTKNYDTKVEATSSNLGHYVDEVINEPEYQKGEVCISFYVNSNEKPKIISVQETEEMDEQQEKNKVNQSEDLFFTYTLIDGSWQKEELLGLNALDQERFISNLFEYSDGKYYLICNQNTYEGKGENQKITQIDYFLYDYDSKTQELKDVSPDAWADLNKVDQEWDPTWWGPESLCVDSENNLIYSTPATNEIHIYNPMTKENKAIDCLYYVNQVKINDDKLYYKDVEKIQVYNLTTQEEEEQIKVTDPFKKNMMISKEGDLYIAGKMGIQKWNPESGSWDSVINEKDSLLGLTENCYVHYSAALDEEQDEFYLLQLDDVKKKIIHTYYDPTATKAKKDRLTIYSLTEVECIRNAVALYQQTHKDINVEYEIGLQAEEEGLVQDELKRVNSELLAGDGADIYVLNGLPKDDFVEKGVLADISYLLQPLIDQGAFLDNMLNCYTEDSGAIYQYPVKFAVPVSIYSPLVTQEDPSFEDLIQITDDNDKVERAIGNTLGIFMNSRLLEYGQDWYTLDKKIDFDQYKAFVNDMVSLKDYCYVYKDQKENYAGANYEFLYYYPTIWLYGDLLSVLNGTCLRYDEIENNTYKFMLLQAYANQCHCHYSIVNNSFLPLARIGMNQNSKNKEQAESFIQSIYTKEFQYDKAANSLPVTKAELKDTIVLDLDEIKEEAYGIQYGDTVISITGREIKEDFMNDLYERVSHVDQPFMEDSSLLVLLARQTGKVLSDEITIEDAVNELSHKMNMFFEE